MTTYYLHLHNRDIDAPDEEGAELADIEAARWLAITGIRDFMSAELKDKGAIDLRGHIEIADGSGAVLATVAFTEAVTIREA
jgi:hypothetical protein